MFESARLKLERAHQHDLHLQKVFGAYAYEHPYRAIVYLDPQSGNGSRVWVDIEATSPLPDELGLLLGDCVHNMRCAIDHMTWELMGIDGGTQNKFTKFPVRDTRQRYEAASRDMPTPREDTKQFFIDLAAYPGGTGQMIYAIHALDNADKHHVITPVAHASQVDSVTFINLETGERVARGPLFTQPAFGTTATLIEAEPGWGIDATENIEPTPEIVFGEVEIVPHQPLLAALAWFYGAVERAIDGAERLVSTRT